MSPKQAPPVAVNKAGEPIFGWWEIRFQREQLASKIRRARMWLRADLSTEAARLNAFSQATQLLDEAASMLDVEVPTPDGAIVQDEGGTQDGHISHR